MLRVALACTGLACTGLVLFAGGLSAGAQETVPQEPGQEAVSALPWPTQVWDRADLPAGLDRDRFRPDLAFDPDAEAIGETRALLIVHRNRIVFEQYSDGFSQSTRFLSWSMAKSITNAFVGLAVADGTLSLEQNSLRPEWRKQGDKRADITVRHLLTMTSGLTWTEFGAPRGNNDAAKAMFGTGRYDQAAYTAAKPLEHEPGTHWAYKTGATTLLARITGDALWAADETPDADARRERTLAFLETRLFKPLGMTSAVPEFDRSGSLLGGSSIYATARDYARFGLLYLRDGVWDGRRLLPEGWVAFTKTPVEAEGSDIYGALFWVTREGGSDPFRPMLWKEGPFDAFQARGSEGQTILIVPSKDLVVVRLGLMSDRNWSALGAVLSEIINSFPDTDEAARSQYGAR